MADRRKIVIDCDPGVDDALAILFALGARDEIDVLALTAVAGNRPVTDTYRNARDLCALAGRADIPVHRGADRRLGAAAAPRTNMTHGEDGLGGVTIPRSTAPEQDTSAADALLDLARRHAPGEISLVAIGPLTNLALAIRKDAAAFARFGEILIMGGAVEVEGNSTPTAEFNFFADPEAADIVLISGVPCRLFPLDVTTKAPVSEAWLDALAAIKSTAGRALAAMLRAYMIHDPLLHDPCPIAWLIAPDLFVSKHMPVRVEFASQWCDGKSIGWTFDLGRQLAPGNSVEVFNDVQITALLDLLMSRLHQLD